MARLARLDSPGTGLDGLGSCRCLNLPVLNSVDRDRITDSTRLIDSSRLNTSIGKTRGYPWLGVWTVTRTSLETSPSQVHRTNVLRLAKPKAEPGWVPLPWREGYLAARRAATGCMTRVPGGSSSGVPGEGTPRACTQTSSSVGLVIYN